MFSAGTICLKIILLETIEKATPRKGRKLQMSSALVQMTRTVPRSCSRLCTMVAAASVLISTCALAQIANDPSRMSGGAPQNSRAQAAYAEWRKLSQGEVNCVDQTLRTQRSNLWLTIQRGISPSDPSVARVRAACHAQAKAPSNPAVAHSGSQALAAVVESPTDKAAADRAAADKAAAEKAASNRATADKATAEKATAEKATAEKATAEKAAAEKAAADKITVDKIAADRATAERAAADKAAADKARAEKAAIELAMADVERARAEVAQPQADAERPGSEPEKKAAGPVFVYSASELRLSFIYGLVSGPLIFCLGGGAFLCMRRRKNPAVARLEAIGPDNAGEDKQNEFDRLVTAVLAEQNRRLS